MPDDDPWEMYSDPIDRAYDPWDEEYRSYDIVVFSGYRVRCERGTWTCSCDRFQQLRICKHVIPFRHQVIVKVKECYL